MKCFLISMFSHFRVDATMAVVVKDADMPQSAPTSLLLEQHAGFIAKYASCAWAVF